MGKQLKVGVHRGDGPRPGYVWSVFILDMAFYEAMKFLRPEQYQHIAQQVKEIAREVDPTHSETASIDAIEDFHELRDTGGILGGLNVRVFFFLDKKSSAIVVLGVIKKQNNGPTPKPDRIRMRRRKRKYLNGEFGQAE